MDTDVQCADICVMGAGPAGCVMAARLAQLGFTVCLVERAQFPRRHLGESLSPGVLPLLDTIGARGDIEAAGFTRVRSVRSNWEGNVAERIDAQEQCLLVDRGRFDALLMERAMSLDVMVLQPATVRERRQRDEGWELVIDEAGQSRRLRVRFLVDATGRSAALPGRRRRTAPRTVALYAYWAGRNLPTQPRIEAGASAWYWGVPLPDGSYNTLAFVNGDSLHLKSDRTLQARFLDVIAGSGLMDGCECVRLLGTVRAANATPYLDDLSVTATSIKVGDSALAIDPLSSSGVQKAIQTSLSGAIVVNTLLRKPDAADAAMQFYRESLAHASKRHCGWAALHYATVAAREDSNFWSTRAAGARAVRSELTSGVLSAQLASKVPVQLSVEAELVDVPLLGADFVGLGAALSHPGLDAPIAYLGGWELAPLLRAMRPGMTPLDVVRSWSPRVPLKSGIAIAGWMLGHGILVSQPFPPLSETRT